MSVKSPLLTDPQPSNDDALSRAVKPRIYAHRGSTLLAPENTLYAFNLATDHGADVLETDVRISRDNEVIVTHDEKLDRTTNGIGAVRAHNRLHLASLDAGYRTKSIHGQRFRGVGIKLLTLGCLLYTSPSPRDRG